MGAHLFTIMKRFLSSLFLVAALTACDGQLTTKTETVKVELVRMTVVEIQRPKHFKITLRDDKGQIWRKSHKHCNEHRRYNVGTVALIPVYTMRDYNPDHPHRNQTYYDIDPCLKHTRLP